MENEKINEVKWGKSIDDVFMFDCCLSFEMLNEIIFWDLVDDFLKFRKRKWNKLWVSGVLWKNFLLVEKRFELFKVMFDKCRLLYCVKYNGYLFDRNKIGLW